MRFADYSPLRLLLAGKFARTFLVSGSLTSAAAGSEEKTAMFVASAESVEISDEHLTLNQPQKTVVWFADRPEREAGSMTLNQFVKTGARVRTISAKTRPMQSSRSMAPIPWSWS